MKEVLRMKTKDIHWKSYWLGFVVAVICGFIWNVITIVAYMIRTKCW
ncbi:hypothetical protein LCGC14_1862190 [marine sediment metagenome]|uniref:Uncharacterized protein n=1 Tax=marine sediment metagenome TaxID=412755 RepID=A0A0F9G7J2_9ZZZZ